MQDMLDIDIRSEVATVVGGASEFTTLMNDLPSLDFDSSSNDGETAWLGGPKWSSTNAHDIYADVGACVNPNSVMPAINNVTPTSVANTTISTSLLNSPKSQLNLNTNTFHASTPLPSPKEKKSHLTFSPNIIKVPVVQETKKQSLLCQAQRANVEAIKKDLSDEIMKDEKIFKQFKTISSSGAATNMIKLAPGMGGLTFANSMTFAKLKSSPQLTNGHTKIITNGNVIATSAQQLKQQHQLNQNRSSSPSQHNLNQSLNNNNVLNNNTQSQTLISGHNAQKLFSRSILVQKGGLIATGNQMHTSSSSSSPTSTSSGTSIAMNALHQHTLTKQPFKVKVIGNVTEPEYPKPAYSYSCLIAMALKNSRAGSLPVSEIYSFMCEHFPYFKTAPNGWKNSVRHNLSLNKCFEKIEKPATNGGQRKGCLWAMNPSKITKMDEEVQKWSRKDPMAIRNAMVFPENLEALERGDMKHGSLNDSEGEHDGNTDTEENSDSDHEIEMDDTMMGSSSIVPDVDSFDDDEVNSQPEFDVEVCVHIRFCRMRTLELNLKKIIATLYFVLEQVSDMYDDIDTDESTNRSFQITLNPENGQTEYIECDQPAVKRARLDINYSIAPAGTFINSNTSGTTQLIQKQQFQNQVQLLQQQQQNRRKMTLVNRLA